MNCHWMSPTHNGLTYDCDRSSSFTRREFLPVAADKTDNCATPSLMNPSTPLSTSCRASKVTTE
ncbi:hypothetical protein BC567DRAFT_236559 [Phyllosticta citribraziliensis]